MFWLARRSAGPGGPGRSADMARWVRRGWARRRGVAIGVVGSGLMASHVSMASPTDVEAGPQGFRAAISETADGLCGGEPCDAVVRGFRHFFDRRLHGLGGNGRSCNDCHMATDHFQLSPANVERRFQLLEWRRRFNPEADDPLF